MKKLIFLLAFIAFGIVASAQSPWAGFFKPVPYYATLKKGTGNNAYEFKFRPTAEMTAVQVLYDKDTKKWNSSALQSAGIGLGLKHYVVGKDGPVVNYGFNALVMLDASPVEDKGAGFGLALTMNVPNFVNFGGGYNFTFKMPYFLLGAIYNF